MLGWRFEGLSLDNGVDTKVYFVLDGIPLNIRYKPDFTCNLYHSSGYIHSFTIAYR